MDQDVARIREGAADHDRFGEFPAESFERFLDNRVMAGTVPEELGGMGVSCLSDVATVLAAVAEADASTALALHVQFSRGLTLNYEWRHGSPPVRALAERLLRGMASDRLVICGAAKDHHTAVTRLTPDGRGGWLLSGRKTLVTLAPIATHFLVHTQKIVEDEPVTLAATVLGRDTPGLSVLPGWEGLGMRASGTCEIVFDNCPVAEEDVLERGVIGETRDSALAGQTVSSITMLGIYAGVARAARDLAIGAAARRSSAPPAAVRGLVSDIEANLYTLRATAAAALANADALNDDLTGDLDERGRSMMVPFQCAKLAVNRLALAVVNDCLTVVGGAAYGAAHPLSRLYRDVRAGWFMQPYTYIDAVDFLSGQALGIDRDNNYLSYRVSATAGR
ncbi:acyl-CoA/acyl-ACP dehydrogenase [Sphaerisporangium sp. TRM90804]|uniref:acyl-CoA dehydrogenase family protein n=1 Tax=Sphaerisporangium sp. TRM90804 TaxID=3031113 RepID=UPI00244CA46E|nr:acyl-CoA/acyl-ACP dehydrogenase [Sphaerisporangium sp. TRM90804]MDH2428954.1 acyl-CoA/acyl-ACP dehydrogenase [Sphaerisporangium sp. TRM90804]